MATRAAAIFFFMFFFSVRKLLKLLQKKKKVPVGTNILTQLLDRKQTFFKGGLILNIERSGRGSRYHVIVESRT